MLVFISCEQDISFKLANKEEKMVLNALLVRDSMPMIHISKSASILADTIEIVNDAKVFLYINDIKVDSLYKGFNGYYKFQRFKVLAQNKYKFEVFSLKHGVTYAEVTVPSMPDIELLAYNYWTEFKDLDGVLVEETNVTVTLKIFDIKNENNFYITCVTSESSDTTSYIASKTVNLICNNAFIEYFDGAALLGYAGVPNLKKNDRSYSLAIGDDVEVSSHAFWFSDIGFSNNYLELVFRFSINKSQDFYLESESDSLIFKYKVNVLSVSKEFYMYASTAFLTNSDPFAEKLKIYSNVINGTGIVASKNFAYKEFTVKARK